MERSLGEVLAKIESLYDAFNVHFYEGTLKRPIITVSPDVTSGAFGWCTAWKAWKADDESDEGFYEINLTAEYLKRPFENICGTLLHEMVHLYNLYENIQDTSRSGTYHNRRFKTEAERRGLSIEKDAKYGWTITDLNDECRAFINTLDKKKG